MEMEEEEGGGEKQNLNIQKIERRGGNDKSLSYEMKDKRKEEIVDSNVGERRRWRADYVCEKYRGQDN